MPDFPPTAAAPAAAPPRPDAGDAPTLRHRLEYAPVWLAKTALGTLPRPAARAIGYSVAAAFYYVHHRLIRVGERNLGLAFPEMPLAERRRLLRRLYHHLGRQLAEFCLFPRARRDTIGALVETVGLEHFLAARARGRGVLILTAHLGAWELSSFAHSLNGYPMKFVIRPLDNPYLNAMVNRYRGLYGNQPIGKRGFARQLVTAMRDRESVGILLDQNSSPPQGCFVPFFGTLACTATGLARIAQSTGAAVVPGFTVWEPAWRRYVLYFGSEIPTRRSGDDEADTVANTAAYTAVLEGWIRRYPDQWLWVHRRWKTRPAGEPSIY
ncbi:MAG: lysophospholipid acyltransferase family protein [Terriglobales bacterium]